MITSTLNVRASVEVDALDIVTLAYLKVQVRNAIAAALEGVQVDPPAGAKVGPVLVEFSR